MYRFFIFAAIILLSFGFLNIVKAQGFCDFYPCGNNDPSIDDSTEDDLSVTFRTGFRLITSLIFTVFIAYGIFLIIKATYIIIRSEGVSEKYEKGYKLIKGVYVGVIMIFIGLIGLLIVAVFFGGVSIFNVELTEPEGVDTPLFEF
ncbi:MAG: hypothetical protein KatS3mg085_308 [Candidatus Dojkabacteria bacterium]|nr:MAG: hypothetical protein KatS3mg085_308 [Candidatus Dojkabacteria bacterium]